MVEIRIVRVVFGEQQVAVDRGMLGAAKVEVALSGSVDRRLRVVMKESKGKERPCVPAYHIL